MCLMFGREKHDSSRMIDGIEMCDCLVAMCVLLRRPGCRGMTYEGS